MMHSRPLAGSERGGLGCLRLSGLQSACEVQFSAQATGWIVRNGMGVAPLWAELCRNVSAQAFAHPDGILKRR